MKYVSILGDSISTYQGYNPAGYAVYYDEEKQRENGLTSVYDTWWAKVNQALHANLCLNNSFSGSKVTGIGFPAACSDERLLSLRKNDIIPDMILCYIGYNDFGFGTQIYNRTHAAVDLNCFFDAYAYMVSKIQYLYPNAQLVCGTLMRTKIRDSAWLFPENYAGIALEQYNRVIRRICTEKGIRVADLSETDIRYETLDGSHPTKEGHETIANAWMKALDKAGSSITLEKQYYVFCPECGEEILPESVFCGYCGKKLSQYSALKQSKNGIDRDTTIGFCTVCGFDVPAYYRFCHRCGRKMRDNS